ncbi:MAG: hypothetical protein J6Q78_00780 [Clostridia bacterium]|nr:hypothetical protein [Clostridia bacterium]
MKKILIIALSMILILLTCSCDNVKKDNDQINQPQNENGNDQSNEAKNEKNQTDESQNENGDNKNPGVSSDDGGFSLNNYEEYLMYIENTDLPEDFVYYDDIKQFGEFNGLAAPQGIYPDSDGIIGYGFDLIYNGKRITLKVVNALDIRLEELFEEDDIQVDLSDMRYPISGKTGIVIHNDIRYIYLEGELYLIRWYENGWSYTINTLYRDVTDFPDNDGSALANLIYLE